MSKRFILHHKIINMSDPYEDRERYDENSFDTLEEARDWCLNVLRLDEVEGELMLFTDDIDEYSFETTEIIDTE